MKDLMQSQKIKSALWILGAVILLLIVFGLGMAAGYRRAVFSDRFGENYFRNFYGGPPGGPIAIGPMGGMPFNMHGVAGEVIDVSSSTISVKDPDGDELSVVVATDAVIREGAQTIMVGDVKPGDMITVIGAPNAAGQIQARFIRIFSASSSLPTSLN
jgi:hypothetical protein